MKKTMNILNSRQSFFPPALTAVWKLENEAV